MAASSGLIPEPITLGDPDHYEQEEAESIPQGDNADDAMGNLEGVEHGRLKESSSAASFMDEIRSAVASKILSGLQDTPSPSFHSGSTVPWNKPDTVFSRSSAELLALPSREAANQMMHVYWTEVHILYPFLLRPRFMESYEEIWTGRTKDVTRSATYCILNLAFALTCQVTKRHAPAEKSSAAEVFVRRATHLLEANVLRRASLELIQALLLLGQYLQSTEWPHRCWVVVGLAIRVSQSLNLHIPSTTAGIPQQAERELARRLWHGCIFMDR